MKADTGQVELLEGVVQVSESLAKKPNIKIVVQVKCRNNKCTVQESSKVRLTGCPRASLRTRGRGINGAPVL